MVDIEFTVQFLILAYASQHSQLIHNLGNIALLGIAAEVGLIDKDLAQAVSRAYRLFRSRQHRLRLDGHEKTRIDIALEPEYIEARSAVSKLWETFLKAQLCSSNSRACLRVVSVIVAPPSMRAISSTLSFLPNTLSWESVLSPD